MFIKDYWCYLMKFLNLLLLTSIVSIVGCSTTPVKYTDSKAVSNERIYAAYSKYLQPHQSGSKVIVVRDSGAMGSAGSASLFVNGEIVARLATSESIVLNVGLGDNLFGIAPGTKLSFEADNTELIEQALHVSPNKTYYYRVTIDVNKGLILQRTSQI